MSDLKKSQEVKAVFSDSPCQPSNRVIVCIWTQIETLFLVCALITIAVSAVLGGGCGLTIL